MSHSTNICASCGSEFAGHPLPKTDTAFPVSEPVSRPAGLSPRLVWSVSFAAWAFIALIDGASTYLFRGSTYSPTSLMGVVGMELSWTLTFAPLTPFVVSLALRFPFQQSIWVRRSLVHLAGGTAFTVAHIVMRGLTPYAFWDPQVRNWVSIIKHSQTHAFQIQWPILKSMFYSGFVDDIVFVYVPIVIIAHAVSYHQSFREGELRKSHLEAQLAKAHLHSLKSQLQPHFLFNTLHSISSLMLTDVTAADQMLSLLSDLLRMSLEGNGAQITTLRSELDFVEGYLKIEKIRFEDRLKVVLDIAPETLDAQVPHLLLQPLVENAVRHGVSKRSSSGEIRVSASYRDRNLHLTIIDNGPGLADAAEVQPSGGGVGLSATRERLRTLYGSEQEMVIRNAVEGGVEVYVRIPFSVDPTFVRMRRP